TTVYFGGPNRRDDAGVAVKNIYRHKHYNPDKASWTQPDIGILELESPIEFNNVTGRVCLPKVYKEEAGAEATVIGWGDDNTVEKYKLNKTVAEWNTVAFYLGDMCADGGIPKFNSSVYICAGGYNTGTEQGDSGGPLVSNLKGRNFLLGLTSAGKQVNDPEGQYDIGAYTRVSFLCDWIEQTTKGEAKCLDSASQPPAKAA
ncbi:Peptidase S1/S6, partial [Aphelenchoides avenae]